jgi:hypothetical protein
LFTATEHRLVFFALGRRILPAAFASAAFAICLCFLNWSSRAGSARPFNSAQFLFLIERLFVTTQMGSERLRALFAGAQDVGR